MKKWEGTPLNLAWGPRGLNTALTTIICFELQYRQPRSFSDFCSKCVGPTRLSWAFE